MNAVYAGLEYLAAASEALQPYKNLIDLILTIAIAYIAVRQVQLDRAQDVRAILDRRLAVYEVLQRLLFVISTSGRIPADEFNAFASTASTKRVRPLFKRRDRLYIEQIRAKVREVLTIQLLEPSLLEAQSGKQTTKRLETVTWLVQQEAEVKKMFSQYLPAED